MKKFIVALLTLLCLLSAFALAEESLENGVYAPDDFSFTGGTGKVTITCPEITVQDGEITGNIVFSSPNYPTLVVDGISYTGEHDEETSSFYVPVQLNTPFEIVGTTTAMSQPHDVTYTVTISLGSSSEMRGLVPAGSLSLTYATGYTVDYFEGGYRLIDIQNGQRALVVPEGMDAPEGLDADILVLQRPLNRIYLAATSVMSLFDRLDALDSVRFSSLPAEDWSIDGAKEAMESGNMLYAGKYSEPDYELLVKESCDLAIENTMILHTPKVQELIELLNIPVLIDRSSYEAHPLGRAEWIKLYGVLLDKEEAAEAFFDELTAELNLQEEIESTGKTVGFFYISADGSAVVRGNQDYISRMIELSGAEYAFANLSGEDSDRASVSVTLEDLCASAVDADYLIYNGSIDLSVTSLESLAARWPLIESARAYQEGHIFLTSRDLYQATDTAALLIQDISRMMNGAEDGFTFLRKLD